jgi:hypothetical protein
MHGAQHPGIEEPRGAGRGRFLAGARLSRPRAGGENRRAGP